ncbi:hypothetical protein AO398_22900 [Methylobacterium sp. GXS13]|uniref:hypothetical protein n=1 Tax=Methylobacterium sp. GXS13 TaxID=1730094 RepID=UPI00071BD51F|nr:hypothetical protein [Methylobacterium sp. GXS13]KST58137.1 hypothetical protein AO398_22900 [Methylobacterium sp. GXS13]
MSGSAPAGALAEYEAIEATICLSERGRWFLSEYARRNRAALARMLLGAMRRLEHAVTTDRDQQTVGQLHGNLVEMAAAISQTKAEIAAISARDSEQTRLTQASLALDAIVRETERATSDILGSAEAIQEAAWVLRERGADAPTCDALDRHATAIYTACSFQDLTAQRTARIVYTLRYLEDRLASMIAIWGSAAEPIPPMPGDPAAGPLPETPPSDLCQSDIDRYIAMEVPAVTAAALIARPGSPPLHEDIVFLPVSDGEGAEAADEAEAFEIEEAPAPVALGHAAVDQDDSENPEPDADWAGHDPVAPEPAAEPEAPILSFAAIDALPPEQRLALFA